MVVKRFTAELEPVRRTATGLRVPFDPREAPVERARTELRAALAGTVGRGRSGRTAS